MQCSVGNVKYGKLCYNKEKIRDYIINEIGEEPTGNTKTDINTIRKHIKRDWKEEFAQAYKPDKKEKDYLLSNFDMWDVMERYENYYGKRFKYLGMLKFHDYDIEKWLNRIERFKGYEYRFILTYYERHWVSIILHKDTVYFLDSEADIEILLGMSELFEKLPFKYLVYNTLEIQYDYRLCGYFSIYFVTSMLAGKDLNKLILELYNKKLELGNKKYYKYIEQLRDKYFNLD